MAALLMLPTGRPTENRVETLNGYQAEFEITMMPFNQINIICYKNIKIKLIFTHKLAEIQICRCL